MQCRLCQQDAELRLSHVVPEFFYEGIYDEKHRMFPRVGGKLEGGPPLQKGLRERLLCGECEQSLSRHEKYVREVVFGGRTVEGASFPDRLELTRLNYSRVRLCFLSILWRMGVATGPAWKAVTLQSYEEPLREMLVSSNPGDPLDFGFFCVLPLIGGAYQKDLILGPDSVRAHRGRFYRVILGGLLCLFFVGSVPFPEGLRGLVITRAGDWVLPIVDGKKIDFLMADARRLVQAREKERRQLANC